MSHIQIADGLSVHRNGDEFQILSDEDEEGPVSFGSDRAVLVAKSIEVLSEAEGSVELDLSDLETADLLTAKQ